MTQLNSHKLTFIQVILKTSFFWSWFIYNVNQACEGTKPVKSASIVAATCATCHDLHSASWFINYDSTMHQYYPEPATTLNNLRQLADDAHALRKIYGKLMGLSPEIVAEEYLRTLVLNPEIRAGTRPDITHSTKVFDRAIVFLYVWDLCDLAGRIKRD